MTSHLPKVSIIMAVYNGERFIRDAVDSILGQNFKDFEFIVVNDASKDKTVEILKSYSDPRLKIISNETNLGQTKSLNKGLFQAKGEYIARIDDDDVALPDQLAKQVTFLNEHPDVGMTACYIDIHDEGDSRVRVWKSDRDNILPEDIFFTLFFENCIAHSSIMARREILWKLGGYNESFRDSQDYELWNRLAKVTKIQKIPKVLLIRKEHGRNKDPKIAALYLKVQNDIYLNNIQKIHDQTLEPFDLLAIHPYVAGKLIYDGNFLYALTQLSKLHTEIIKSAPSFLNRELLERKAQSQIQNLLTYTNRRVKINTIANSFLLTENVILTKPQRFEIWKKYLKMSFDMGFVFGVFAFVFAVGLVIWKIARLIIKKSRLGFLYSIEYLRFCLKSQKAFLNHKPRKNILFVMPYMVAGGAERVTLNIADCLNRKEFSLNLLTSNLAVHSWHKKFAEKFDNIIVPYRWMVVESIFKKYLYKMIKVLNIDVIFVSNSSLMYKYLPEIRSKFPGVKIIDLMHAQQSFGALEKNDWAAPYIDRRICISQLLRDFIVQRAKDYETPEYEGKVKVIYNGIVIPELANRNFKSQHHISNEVQVVSFIGRFSGEKDPLLFVAVAQEFAKQFPQQKIKFVMAGDGPMTQEVKRKIAESAMAEHFILPGVIEEPAELLADSDLLLVVSKSEGIPLVILEAMAMNVPVISTRVGAIHEVVENNVNGILIDRDQHCVSNFVTQMNRLLNSPETVQQFVQKARKQVLLNYSLESMHRQYQKLFKEIINPVRSTVRVKKIVNKENSFVRR